MRNLEDFLYELKSDNQAIPNSFTKAIKEFSSKSKERGNIIMKINVIKKSIIIATSLLLGSGVVFATTKTYENIWKQPESYTINKNVTEEEKNKCISKEKAEEIGNNYLKKIGFDEQTIQNMILSKDFLDNENIWELGSEKVSMRIDAETGKIKSVNIPTWKYKIPYNYGITREEARKVAKQLLEKYKLEEDMGEYELISLKRNSEQDKEAYIWYADFYKKYGNLTNPEERINIGWIPTINGLYSLDIATNTYENNEQKITKEEAIKIAIEKDNKIETKKTIKDTKAEIRIKQMNENVYLRENFKEEYEKGTLNMEKTEDNTYKLKDNAVMYKTEERVRKVWCVVVIYDITETYYGYTYYIDATTGEIIGGQNGNDFYGEDGLREDPNNVIEK